MPSEKCFQDARDGETFLPRWIVVNCPRLIRSLSTDPYYENIVKADEAEFIDVSKSLVLFGWEEVYIEEGKVLSQ